MKNLLWFLLGIVSGFIAAHLVNKDPRGHELLAEVDTRITEFTERMGDAYRDQESRIAELVSDTTSSVADSARSTSD